MLDINDEYMMTERTLKIIFQKGQDCVKDAQLTCVGVKYTCPAFGVYMSQAIRYIFRA